jgi:uncharacterized protein (DUF433 family)
MRITVGTILGLLDSGHPAEEILKDYPYLEEEDIQAALAWDYRQQQDPASALP